MNKIGRKVRGKNKGSGQGSWKSNDLYINWTDGKPRISKWMTLLKTYFRDS